MTDADRTPLKVVASCLIDDGAGLGPESLATAIDDGFNSKDDAHGLL